MGVGAPRKKKRGKETETVPRAVGPTGWTVQTSCPDGVEWTPRRSGRNTSIQHPVHHAHSPPLAPVAFARSLLLRLLHRLFPTARDREREPLLPGPWRPPYRVRGQGQPGGCSPRSLWIWTSTSRIASSWCCCTGPPRAGRPVCFVSACSSAASSISHSGRLRSQNYGSSTRRHSLWWASFSPGRDGKLSSLPSLTPVPPVSQCGKLQAVDASARRRTAPVDLRAHSLAV